MTDAAPTNRKVPDGMIAMAEIVGVHGVRGLVKLKAYGNDAEALAEYGEFTDASGKIFTIAEMQLHGNIWLAEFEGLADRTAAEKLRGTVLYMPRDNLPKIEDEKTFYHIDLIGLAAVYPDGAPMGKIMGVANFGAGDLLEIKPIKGASFYVPFTDEAVPEVSLEKRQVTVDPPPGLLD